MQTQNRMRKLTGTAVLSALVIVFDYSLKFSNFKIPFPWMPVLKFDFTGIPIALSLFLYGLPAAATTSLVALLGILARSGDVVGATMKALAELSTVLGFSMVSSHTRTPKVLAFISGGILRVLIMSVANLVVLPAFYATPFNAALLLIPANAIFNLLQGLVSMFGGLIIYEALKRRIPSLMTTTRQ
ncbi:MAG: ECF transporter S component [archaeon]